MSKKIVKKILESKLIESDNNDENNGNFLCAHFHDVVFQDISAVGVLNVNVSIYNYAISDLFLQLKSLLFSLRKSIPVMQR